MAALVNVALKLTIMFNRPAGTARSDQQRAGTINDYVFDVENPCLFGFNHVLTNGLSGVVRPANDDLNFEASRTSCSEGGALSGVNVFDLAYLVERP